MVKKRNTVNQDMELKNFWRNNDHFADLCNAVLFQGCETVKATDLEEQDTDMSGIIFSEENRESIFRTRDVVKKIAYGIEFMIVGIENQTKVHYAMPLRVALYDNLGYLKQSEAIKANRKESKKPETATEFLSGFGKDDQLAPIITLVIYYGNTPWDGPLSLHDMLGDISETLKNLVSNQQLNLIQIRSETEYIFHNEDVKRFFLITQAFFMKDKEAITKLTKNLPLNSELVEVIGKVINSKELMRYLEKEQKEELEMCELLEEIREEGKAEGIAEGIEKGIEKGRAEGIVSTLRSLKWETSEILKQLMNELGLSEAECKKFL